jgi:hypothetical protein
MSDAQQPLHFWAPNNVVRYTTKELLIIVAQYTTKGKAVVPLSIRSTI